MLHALRHDWAPACMLVSFKLETDESILIRKVSQRTKHCVPLLPKQRLLGTPMRQGAIM